MKQRFRRYCRKKGGRYYLHDDQTGKQESLHASARATATRLLHAKNEASQQSAINLQIARAFLAATDPQIATRTCQFVMDEAAIRAIETLKPTGVPLEMEPMQFAEAHALLAGASLLEAVRFFRKQNPDRLPKKNAPDGMDEMVEAKEADKRSAGHVKDLKPGWDGSPPSGESAGC